jgi:uncharacterized membrane protein YccC
MKILRGTPSPFFLLVVGLLFILAAWMMFVGSKRTQDVFATVTALVGLFAVAGGVLRFAFPEGADTPLGSESSSTSDANDPSS